MTPQEQSQNWPMLLLKHNRKETNPENSNILKEPKQEMLSMISVSLRNGKRQLPSTIRAHFCILNIIKNVFSKSNYQMSEIVLIIKPQGSSLSILNTLKKGFASSHSCKIFLLVLVQSNGTGKFQSIFSRLSIAVSMLFIYLIRYKKFTGGR